MVDAQLPEPVPTPGRCPWCSAALPDAAATTCPSCGATLIGEGEQQVPGVNALDAEAILRAARGNRSRPRSRLLSWISGETDDELAGIQPDSLAPPPPDVQREMLRLELAAQVADLQGEASTVIAEAEVEAREAGWRPGDPGSPADADDAEVDVELDADAGAADAGAADVDDGPDSGAPDVDAPAEAPPPPAGRP